LRVDTFSYLWLVIGSVADEITTRIGLTFPGVYEANEFARELMGKGLWLAYDISLVALSIIGVSCFYKIIDKRYRDVILLYPILLGTFRLTAAIWNIIIILL